MIFDNIKNCEMYYGLNKGFKAAFDFIKKHYSVINKICGIFLIIIGISMIFGFMDAVLSVFS